MQSLFTLLPHKALLIILVFCPGFMFAQAPAIKYTTPHVYEINKPIATLVPTNTGGAVPATIYGQVSTVVDYGLVSVFFTITGLAVDKDGNFFIEDWGENQIKKITPAGKLSVFAGSGAAGSADGKGRAASFSEPDGIVIGPTGDFFVSDQATNLIRKVSVNADVTTFAGSGAAGAANGKGKAASFNSPRGLAVDGLGNIYVADQANNMVRKITPDGTVSTYAGSGAMGSADALTPLSASFNTPTAVGLDTQGNLYVSDSGNGSIRKITPAGVVSTFARGFNFPRELRADGTGNVYVGDQQDNLIKRISPTGVVTVVAGSGARGGADGIGTAASFAGTIGMVLDGKGNMFLGESGYNTVRKITITGYTIDKPLPAGLVFDATTGKISGTPTVLWPATDYTVTAYNATGSNSTVLNLQVVAEIVLKPSIINFPPPVVMHIDPDNILHPDATSTNTQTPITYTSSNPAVAYVGADGQIHVIAPGVTIITAHQQGNESYTDALPVSETYTITQDQVIAFPAIVVKNVCSIDFAAGAVSSNSIIPLTYTSSNTAVATVSATGNIHITGPGSTTIEVSQSGNNLYNAATPVSQILTVEPLVTPSVKVTPDFYSICEGVSVTYTAAALNQGNNPTYQWQLNGINSGDGTDKYTSSTLKTGDKVTCVVTNNDGCTPVSSAVSTPVTLTADANVTTSVVISSSATGAVAFGTPITFKATPSANVQDIPAYSWQVNGQSVGTNSPNFTSQQLLNGDVVTCTMVSGGTCVINPSVTSNAITVSIFAQNSTSVFVPNAFTPNGDGANDVWSITDLMPLPDCTVNVYNRYGIRVFYSVGYQHPWDGSINGRLLPSGTYYYIIDPKNGGSKLSGPVTMIR